MKKMLLDAERIIEDNAILIICKETGIFYEVQAGGMGCTHPNAEGFIISWHGWDQTESESSPDHKLLCGRDFPIILESGHDGEKIIKTLITELKKINLELDESRISQMQENWIPVFIALDLDYDTEGKRITEKFRAWYCGGNCD